MENIYKRAIINSNKVVEYMQDDLSRDIYMARVIIVLHMIIII